MKPWDVTPEAWEVAVSRSEGHHLDGAHRTEEAYQLFELNDEACALCAIFNTDNSRCFSESGVMRVETNKLCPLYKHDDNLICNSYWRNAINAKDNRNFPAFHKAEFAQVALLKQIRERGYDAWFGDCIKRMKGEEIELEYSDTIIHQLNIPPDGKAIFRLTGDFRIPKQDELHYYQSIELAYMGKYDETRRESILEFVRMVDEPEMPKYFLDGEISITKTTSDKCDTCTHEFVLAKPEFKAGDIVKSYTAGGCFVALREIQTITNRYIRFVGDGKDFVKNVTLATDAETLTFWEDKCTIIRNGVVLRAYEDEACKIRILWNNNGVHSWEYFGRVILKALDLEVIPFKISKGKYISPK